MCNRLIKFGAFDRKRGHDYDLIATGHYAQTEFEPGPLATSSANGIKWLTTAPDPVKDQTDFLAQIEGWQLRKALFPIGHMMKDEVRRIAEQEHLVSAHRKDSQGICFLGKIDYTEYVRRFLGEQPGDVIELETGHRIGAHRGHWFYTIGQRKGLGLGGGPWFIVKKDVARNVLFVSHGYDPATAYKQVFPIIDFHSLNGVLPEGEVTLKIRHTPEFTAARLTPQGDGRYLVEAAVPIHGVAPGQFCVIYDAHYHRCYGSGEISV
jgi:tRNA-specific 2-thiouridylase